MRTPRRHLVELQELGISGLGHYAEWLVAEALGGERSAVNTPGFDVLAPGGERIQVKCRAPNPPTAVPDWAPVKAGADGAPNTNFDAFVGVNFDDEYRVTLVVKLTREQIPNVARREKGGTQYRIHGSAALLDVGEDLTDRLRSVQDREDAR